MRRINWSLLVFVTFFLFLAKFGDCGSPHDVYKTVYSPVVDGVNIDVPKLIPIDMAKRGIVDVTQKPFYADKSGLYDSTDSIQKAIEFARDNQLVCYFPSGRYLVSKTLKCTQKRYMRSNGNIMSARLYPCVLRGDGPEESEIVLKPNSKGFRLKIGLKPVIEFSSQSPNNADVMQPDMCFNQRVEGIKISIGKGNPNAVGIRMEGAQGSGVEDCIIDVRFGYAGIEGGAGAGGSFRGVTVFGGGVGLIMLKTQPAPLIVGVNLLGQSNAAIIYKGSGSLVGVDVTILYEGRGSAIRGIDSSQWPFLGQLTFVGLSVECRKQGVVGIKTLGSVYLENAVFKGCELIYEGNGNRVIVSDEDCVVYDELAVSGVRGEWRSASYSFPTYINGEKKPIYMKKGEGGISHSSENLPPRIDLEMCCDITLPPYNVPSDGVGDAYPGIQKALQDSNCIFMPKGYYALSKPIKVIDKKTIVGVAQHLTVVMPHKNWKGGSADNPDPIVDVQGVRSVNLMNFSVYTPTFFQNTYGIRWSPRNGGVVKNVNIRSMPPWGGYKQNTGTIRNYPLVLIKNAGKTKWYDFNEGDLFYQGKDYRHLKVINSGPVIFYMLNLEHASSDFNCELVNSRNVKIYALKGEGNTPLLRIENCNDIRVLGFGGNAAARPGESLFYVSRSKNYKFVNIVPFPWLLGMGGADCIAGVGQDPKSWSIISDDNYLIRPEEYPVLYGVQ